MIKIDVRKLISFGKGSYVISLPKYWIEKNNIKKGSILSLEPNANSLLVSTTLVEHEDERKTITISGDDKPMEELETEIVSAYLTNYDIIEIVSKKLKNIDEEVKKVIMNLAGLEILEQTSTKLTAKYLLNIKEISFESLIRRMDNITRSLMIDTAECLNGACNYESVRRRDLDVNRLHFLLLRTARADMTTARSLFGKTAWQLYSVLEVSGRLEKIADRQKRIARGLNQLHLSKNFANELNTVYDRIKDSYIDVMKAYYQCDKNLARQIELTNRERTFVCDNLLSKDFEEEYQIIKNAKDKGMYVHQHMIMTDIVFNLKAMARSVKTIARCVMNCD